MRNPHHRTPYAVMQKLLSLALLVCLLLGACLSEAGRVQADELPRGGREGGSVPVTAPTAAPDLEPETEPAAEPVAEPTPAPPVEDVPPEAAPPEGTPFEDALLAEPAQANPPAAQVRFGVATNSNPWDFQYFGDLKAGWYHNWDARAWELTAIPDVEYTPMVGAWGELWGSETEQMLRSYIEQCPECYPDGTVWIVGNEPEQDRFDTINGVPITPRAATPEEYAQKYKKYYDMIKGINPTYKVAVGATYDDPSWPDATRCNFIPKARQAYEARYGEKMPIDVYTLHAYMDQLDAPLFQLETMVQRKRRIMNDYGDRDKPLLVTEMGVLTALRNPVPSANAISTFMDSAFDYLATATSEELGCPGDANRMVQRWAWFALTSRNPSQGDDYWKGTDLLDIHTGNMTPAGQTYASYPKTPPPIPSGFWGTAKKDGANVANGTPVTAWIGGVQVAQATSLTADGSSAYSLDVPGDDPSTPERDGGTEGDTIQFKIGNEWAKETATWHSGTILKLNLSVNANASSGATHFSGAGYWSDRFGVSDGWSSYNTYPRASADVNGDGKADLIGFKNDGVYVALSTGSGFGAPTRWVTSYATNAGGWASYDRYPRVVADVNGDGKADIIGFGQSGALVALSTGGSFGATSYWTTKFGAADGWSSQNLYPRTAADVNGDGKADLVGFKDDGVYVALSTGSGFGAPTRWIAKYATNAGGWASYDRYPRVVADVNGDGKADIIGFGQSGALVALSTGSSFGATSYWTTKFGVADGWSSQNLYPRTSADVNGDGKADLVGFKDDGVYVALSTGSGFGAPTRWVESYATQAGGWSSNDHFPRTVADANGDGEWDVVAFGQKGVIAALAEGANVGSTSMTASTAWMLEEAEARAAWREAQKTAVSDDWRVEQVDEVIEGEPLLASDVQGVRLEGDKKPQGAAPVRERLNRWTRALYLAEGVYEFRVPSEADARLWVDGYIVLDGHAEVGVLGLDEGVHTITLECQECALDAPPDVAWELLTGASSVDMPE
jgi:hypothetical protein